MNAVFDRHHIKSHAIKAGLQPIAGVKNIIAIASGKGGVGKSTVAVNLALALSRLGAQVGLLDADIYGPSQPLMLGTQERRPETQDQKSIEPVVQYDLETMSIGYLIDESQAAIWRGPMASTALQQLMRDTRWHDRDVVIVDLPPGTGDIQLTLAQKIPVTGIVVVTTPQEAAIADARKAIAMFQKVALPVLGIIENMAHYICPHCHHSDAIFGHGGGEALAATHGVKMFGRIPLLRTIQEQADEGRPTVIAEPDAPVTQAFLTIAKQLLETMAALPRSYAGVMPGVRVE